MRKTNLYILFFVLLSCVVSAISVTENNITVYSNDEYAVCDGRTCSYDFTVQNEKTSDSQPVSLTIFSNDFKTDVIDISSFDKDVVHTIAEPWVDVESYDCSYYDYGNTSSQEVANNESEPNFVSKTCYQSILKENYINVTYDDFALKSLKDIDNKDDAFKHNKNYCSRVILSGNSNVNCSSISDYSGLKMSEEVNLSPLTPKQFRINFKVPLLSNGKFDINIYSSNVTILDPFVNNYWFTEPFDGRSYINNASTNASISNGKAWLGDSARVIDNFEDSSINASLINYTEVEYVNGDRYITSSQSESGGKYDLALSWSYYSDSSVSGYGRAWFNDSISDGDSINIYSQVYGDLPGSCSKQPTFYFQITNGSSDITYTSYSSYCYSGEAWYNMTLNYSAATGNFTWNLNGVTQSPFSVSSLTGSLYLKFKNYGATTGTNTGSGTTGMRIYEINKSALLGQKSVYSIDLAPAVSIGSFSAKYNDSGANCTYYYSIDNSSWVQFNNITTYYFDTQYNHFYWKADLLSNCIIYDLNFSFSPEEQVANESAGRNAIGTGIMNALKGNYTTYTDQQVYGRHVNGTQMLGSFDKFVLYAGTNQRWAFNYDQNSSAGFTNMFNITPVFYVLELVNISPWNITNTVESFINSTKQG